jgi:putative ABC transport system permease protein
VNLEFHICGILSKSIDPMALWLRRDYLEEALGNPGIVNNFWLLVDSFESIPKVIRAVDEMFANSPYPVKAETEKSFMNMFLAMMGNIRGLVGGIGMIVVVTIMLVAGNTVAMSVRERTAEIALLKALGFRARMVLALVLAESCVVAVVGGVLGAGSAYVFYGSPRLTTVLGPYASFFQASSSALAEGLVTALVVGIVSGLLPAMGAARLHVAEALRRVV